MDRRNLKVLRVRHGMTQKKMAEKVGCSRSIYSEIEKGTRNCSTKFLSKLQAAFGIPDSEIWELTKVFDEKEV